MEPPLRFDVVDDETARMLRAKTGAERLAIAAGLFRSARTISGRTSPRSPPTGANNA